MAQGIGYTVNCGRHATQVQHVLDRILQLSGLQPCIRQDGSCNTAGFSVATGTAFIQFFNVPPEDFSILASAANQAKAEILEKRT